MPLKKNGFDASFKSLEETLDFLEKGDIPLEDFINKYKKSVKLLNFCQNCLNLAEMNIERIEKK